MPDAKSQRLRQYRRLLEIDRELSSLLDLNILLSSVVHAAVELSGAQKAYIVLYDEALGQLRLQKQNNSGEFTNNEISIPLEGSLAGWVIKNRQPLRLANARTEPQYQAEIMEVGETLEASLIGIPLIARDKVIGVLEVVKKNNGGFTKLDEELLLFLGKQAAIAIENVLLFQQTDLISEFVHEIRTPLASLGTAVYLLLHPEVNQEQREQVIRNIRNETTRLNALASAFLDLTRLESGRTPYHWASFSVTDLFFECKDIMSSRAQDGGIHLRIAPAEESLFLRADREKIKQVLLNLLSNAIKYNRTNGTVLMYAEKAGSQIILHVQDTGLGIPDSALPHLFKKFYRIPEHDPRLAGAGLGLAQCKQIVLGHAGRIEVRSKVGVGTVFSIFLPA